MTGEAFVLGVDLDGVCGDFTEAFRRVVSEELGLPLAALPVNRSWGFEEWNLPENTLDELFRSAAVKHRMLKTMDPIEGAVEALWRLSDAGVWIRIVTHRLYVNWSHAVVVADTVAWLDRVQIPYRDICFLGTKPDVACDCYIDDAPHNVSALRGVGNEVICFAQPYNTEVAGPRVETWAEAEELILEMASGGGHHVQVQLPGFPVHVDRLASVRRSGPQEPTDAP